MKKTVIFVFLFILIGCSKQVEYPPDIIELIKYVVNNPNDAVGYEELIENLYEKKYYKDTLIYSKKLLKIFSENYYGYIYIGLSNEVLKKWDEAEKYYNEFCRRFPKMGTGYYSLARLQYKMGQYENSMENLNKVIGIGIGGQDVKVYIDMTIFLARCYYYSDNITEAYHILDKVLELDPLNKDILYNYGVWLLREGKYKDAIERLNRLINQNSQEAAPYISLGKAYYHLHEWAEAEKAFSDAIRFYPGAKVFADIVHLQDLDSTYKEINTAVIRCYEQYDYKYDDKYYVRGIIENIGLEMAQWVSVIVYVYDKKGSIITKKVFEVSPRNIRPEQYTFFKVEIPYNEAISNIKIEPNWHKREAPTYFYKESEEEEAGRVLLW